MSCKKYKKEDLILYIYGEHDEYLRVEIENHLHCCEHCMDFLREYNQMEKFIDKHSIPEYSPLILERLNKKIMERIEDEKASPIREKKNLVSILRDIVYFPFSRPAYTFSTLVVTFVLGIIIGKLWMSSAIIEDPKIIASVIEGRKDMSIEEKEYIKKLVASYFLGSSELEVKELKDITREKQKRTGTGRAVQINFEVKKEMGLTGGLDDPVILNMLRYSALHDNDPDKRARALRLLVLSNRFYENKEVFLSSLLNEKEYKPRYVAFRYLKKYISDKEVKEVLKKVLLNDPDVLIRREAFEVLANTADQSLIPIFALVAYRETDDSLRSEAKAWLDRLSSKRGK